LSEAELADLVPVEFQDINDPDATAEPSKGALIQLAAGPFVVLFYGKESGRLVLESPVSASAVRNVRSFLEEVPIPLSKIFWKRPDVLTVFSEAKPAANAASSPRNSAETRRSRSRSRGVQQRSEKAGSGKIKQPASVAEASGNRPEKTELKATRNKKAAPKKARETVAEKAQSKGRRRAPASKQGLDTSSKGLAKAAKAI
jgi:hypothetical protein